MKRIALMVYCIAGVGVLATTFLELDIVHIICKPLLMLSLGLYYRAAVDADHRANAVNLAIFFSLIGDVFLMLQGTHENFFIAGLASFLVAHIFYILAYRLHRLDHSDNEILGVQRIRMAFPVILAGTGLVIVLYPVLGPLQIPVMTYALMLVVMVLQALFRMGRTNTLSFWSTFIGALLFMISDSLIAVDRFLSPVSHAGFIIMTTYIAAQFLIISGLLKHYK